MGKRVCTKKCILCSFKPPGTSQKKTSILIRPSIIVAQLSELSPTASYGSTDKAPMYPDLEAGFGKQSPVGSILESAEAMALRDAAETAEEQETKVSWAQMYIQVRYLDNGQSTYLV